MNVCTRRRGIRLPWVLAGVLSIAAALSVTSGALAQEGSSIPPEYRGSAQAIARGILDGNLIETNFRNHGEVARWNDNPWGIWPRNIGGRHIDGIAMIVAGLVRGERDKWAHLRPEWAGLPDTLLNPVSINYRDAGRKLGPDGNVWGWLPLAAGAQPGFHNPLRISPITGQREPVPALSTDSTSWPAFWPDRLDQEDAGWPGQWNGAFGKGVFNADLESFYVVDDYTDHEYLISSTTNQPFSQYGVFYPDPTDSTKGGMALQVNVRIFQWANVLAEDTMFMVYRITNTGQTDYGNTNVPGDPRQSGLYFAKFVDFGMGEIESDESAAFDPILDIAYGWDHDGIGTRPDGSLYDLGYTGFAFLESPTNSTDGIDNDEDGIIDESRFSGPGERIVGQAAIRQYVEANYLINRFINWHAPGGTLDDALATRRAYAAGVWWTGDENMDWLGFDDANGNGVWDPGELLNDDYGRDGLGPFDPNYPGPDLGEADGIPTIGEPNFDETDVDEGDQIGLTGFHLSDRPFYESGDNLRNDWWMWARISESQFPVGTEPEREIVADVEPFLNFSSGPVKLRPQGTDFFSLAWLFGADEEDFFNNRRVVQQIYNADYRFAQPPIMPKLTAQAGDRRVILSWDTLSIASFDRFSQEFDFEGYKLYKGTDPLLSDARVVTDFRGTATFYRPIAQWDLQNGIRGRVPVMGNDAVYNLGNDTGLQFSYIDTDVTNGKTYYYALVAYDRGFSPGPDAPPGSEPIDPQENIFNITVDQGGQLRNFSQNVAVVVPRANAAGYTPATADGDLSRPTGTLADGQTRPKGTGSAMVTVVDNDVVPPDAVYRLVFFDTTTVLVNRIPQVYETTGFELRNVTDNTVLIPRQPFRNSTPVAAGITLDLVNHEISLDPDRSGWIGQNEAGEEVVSRTPGQAGIPSNWALSVAEDSTTNAAVTADQFELMYTTDSLYSAPSFIGQGGPYIAAEIPFWCTNTTRNVPCQLIVLDSNDNGEFDLGDQLIINERLAPFGSRLFRHRVSVRVPAGQESFPPPNGSRIRIAKSLPFAGGDYFQFAIRQAATDVEEAQNQLANIAVVPNPYVLAAEWEPRTQISGRGPRMIQFINLPETCTIRIFTIRGELVKTIDHNGQSGSGAAWWDLKSEGEQDIAYGMYLYHVEAIGIGEKTGKFAIIK